MTDDTTLTLELIEEHKLHDLLPGELGGDFEASGVCVRGEDCYVVFDNTIHVARIHSREMRGRLLRRRGEATGYEDIAWNERDDCFYALVESRLWEEDIYKARVEVFDRDFRPRGGHWLDFPLLVENKGLEGLAWINRQGQDYLLGLCEGNKCHGGALGRKPGGGRIQVFQPAEAEWPHAATLKLPKSVRFEDYSGLDVSPLAEGQAARRLAVVSQSSSALWVGILREDRWEFVDDGQVYLFPLSRKGKPRYCNLEGVAWLGPDQVVVVSDRMKPGKQRAKCARKDQSIHVFRLPA